MLVKKYDDKTRAMLVSFLRSEERAKMGALERCGSDKKRVNWDSLKKCLKDLEAEGVVVREPEKKAVYYRYVGVR